MVFFDGQMNDFTLKIDTIIWTLINNFKIFSKNRYGGDELVIRIYFFKML